MRHLFLAPLGSAFGEALHGVRIARQLVAAGHEVVFLAPAAMSTVIDDAPVQFGRIDQVLPRLDAQVADAIRDQRCEALVLVDAAAVGKVARTFQLDVRAFTHPGIPVVALDCWNLVPQPVRWEYGATAHETLAPEIHAIERRLVPVPIASPDVRGGFRAMPEVSAHVDRRAIRTQLGLDDQDRLILWPSASWQAAESHTDPGLARLAAMLPELILPRLDQLGPRVHVIHVGPTPFANAAQLAPRYRFLSQLLPRNYEQLVASADLVIGFNSVATSVATAIAARTPILVGTTSLRADTMAEVEQALGDRLTPAVRAALAPNLPLAPIHAWPLRLGEVLEPVLADNPIDSALRRVDPFDEAAYVEACRELLWDPATAGSLRLRQATYHRRVVALPAGHELLMALLGA